ncbi:hypothetical protein EVAR_69059_1 [Eumeta japonica]|uniref:Uncharacterized protein n=1 Tax=Eumeta variegata TaxID=151549 RepID=A0A4C1ZHZ3_EUMVA|nr:hypothetical protein EVAR_69059_1 [Eumeta japonica]
MYVPGTSPEAGAAAHRRGQRGGARRRPQTLNSDYREGDTNNDNSVLVLCVFVRFAPFGATLSGRYTFTPFPPCGAFNGCSRVWPLLLVHLGAVVYRASRFD